MNTTIILSILLIAILLVTLMFVKALIPLAMIKEKVSLSIALGNFKINVDM